MKRFMVLLAFASAMMATLADAAWRADVIYEGYNIDSVHDRVMAPMADGRWIALFAGSKLYGFVFDGQSVARDPLPVDIEFPSKPLLTVGTDGTVHAVVTDDAGRVIHLRRSPSGWALPEILSDDPTWPAVKLGDYEIAPDGALTFLMEEHVHYTHYTNLVYRTGGVWVKKRLGRTFSTGNTIGLLLAPGEPRRFFLRPYPGSNTDPFQIVLYTETADGFDEEIVWTNPPQTDIYASGMIAPDGDPMLAVDGIDPNDESRFVTIRKRNGGAWDEIRRLPDEHQLQMELGPDGAPRLLTWNSVDNTAVVRAWPDFDALFALPSDTHKLTLGPGGDAPCFTNARDDDGTTPGTIDFIDFGCGDPPDWPATVVNSELRGPFAFALGPGDELLAAQPDIGAGAIVIDAVEGGAVSRWAEQPEFTDGVTQVLLDFDANGEMELLVNDGLFPRLYRGAPGSMRLANLWIPWFWYSVWGYSYTTYSPTSMRMASGDATTALFFVRNSLSYDVHGGYTEFSSYETDIVDAGFQSAHIVGEVQSTTWGNDGAMVHLGADHFGVFRANDIGRMLVGPPETPFALTDEFEFADGPVDAAVGLDDLVHGALTAGGALYALRVGEAAVVESTLIDPGPVDAWDLAIAVDSRNRDAIVVTTADNSTLWRETATGWTQEPFPSNLVYRTVRAFFAGADEFHVLTESHDGQIVQHVYEIDEPPADDDSDDDADDDIDDDADDDAAATDDDASSGGDDDDDDDGGRCGF